MPSREDDKLAIHDIAPHQFEDAKNKLKELTSESQTGAKITAVETAGGPLGLFKHKVNGTELNTVMEEVEAHLVSIKGVQARLTNEMLQTYRVIEALDSEYLKHIVASIVAIDEVNKKTLKNTQDLEDALDNQEKLINAIKNFQGKLRKLEHLMDIDTAWELLQSQKETIHLLTLFKDDLSKQQHLGSIDTIWQNQNNLDDELNQLQIDLQKVSVQIEEACAALKALQNLQQAISSLAHLSDVDVLWEEMTKLKPGVTANQERIKHISDDIAQFQNSFSDAQTAFDMFKSSFEKNKEDILRVLDAHKLSIDELLSQSYQIQNDISNLRSQIETDILRIDGRIDVLSSKIDEDDRAYTERLTSLENKIKYAYWIAGISVAITIIHILIDIVGAF